jgi:peptidoglycan/xylan/chitin deacetylase (PgdA/CDA1 family)
MPTQAEIDAALTRLVKIGKPVYCAGGRKPYAAFTFDDGPGVYTSLALKILGKAHIPPTFFLVGRLVPQFPALPPQEARVAALGDHTWSHPYLPGLTPAGVQAQLADTKAAIKRATGVDVRLFRPPYGAHNATVDATAQRLGMVEVLWNVDSADSLGANWAGIARNVESGLRPGAIVLMHENRGQTLRALGSVIIPWLRHQHITLVTVPQLLALDPPTRAQLDAGPAACGIGGPLKGGG